MKMISNQRKSKLKTGEFQMNLLINAYFFLLEHEKYTNSVILLLVPSKKFVSLQSNVIWNVWKIVEFENLLNFLNFFEFLFKK